MESLEAKELSYYKKNIHPEVNEIIFSNVKLIVASFIT
jgi:hypothetical protein